MGTGHMIVVVVVGDQRGHSQLQQFMITGKQKDYSLQSYYTAQDFISFDQIALKLVGYIPHISVCHSSLQQR